MNTLQARSLRDLLLTLLGIALRCGAFFSVLRATIAIIIGEQLT